MERLLDVISYFAAMLDPLVRTSSAARRARNISQFQELVLLGKRRQDLIQAILSLQDGKSLLQQLDNMKLGGYIREDLSVDPDEFRKQGPSYAERGRRASILTLPQDIQLLEKALKWPEDLAVPLEIGLGLLSINEWRR